MLLRKDKIKSIQKEFPIERTEISLNELPWEYCENFKGKAWETILLNKIEKISPMLVMHLASFKNQKIGGYQYYFLSNRIERTHPTKIKPKTKIFEKFRLSSIFTVRIKKRDNKGIIYKVE